MLDLDCVDVCDEIRSKLKELSTDIVFTKESLKGGNGYLFFGDNQILNRRVAVKFYYWGGDSGLHAEPQQLASLKADNIIEIYDASLVDREWSYFITPFCPAGDIDDYLESGKINKLSTAVELVCGTLAGLCVLHSKGFVHRDLKPANILVSPEGKAMIGDFGSLKPIPENKSNVTGSGHSILYRPPESIETNSYSVLGDIYQIGILLYQLVGGYLPYEEEAWLSKNEKLAFDEANDYFEKGRIADSALKEKIKKGKVLKLDTLPLIVPMIIKKIIKKASHKEPSMRYQSASEFLAEAYKAKQEMSDWVFEDNCWRTDSPTQYRFKTNEKVYSVEKRKTASWRRDNGFGQGTACQAVEYIRKQI